LKDFGKLTLLVVLLALLVAAGHCASAPELPAELDTKAAAAIAGEWGIEIKLRDHTEDAVLRFSFDGRELTGSFRNAAGTKSDLVDIRVSGGRISWEMERQHATLAVSGAIEGTIMSGKIRTQRKPTNDSESAGQSPEDSPGGRTRGGGRRGHVGGGRGHSSGGESLSWTAVKRQTPS
jgi:hypothetical protein